MSSTIGPEQKEPQPPRPEGAAAEGHEAAEQASIREVDALHALVNEYKARDDQNSRLQRRNFWLGVVTACLLFTYTTLTFFSWLPCKSPSGWAVNSSF